MTKYYLDTCIWRDYLENRKDKFRPLGEWAFQLIKQIVNNEDKIIISDLLIEELKTEYSDERIKELFSIVPEELIEQVHSSSNQIKEAVIIARNNKFPYKDTLHAILSKYYNSIFVTRDNHFESIRFIRSKKPEELI
jgi:predicted nucleic acid-binding protein